MRKLNNYKHDRKSKAFFYAVLGLVCTSILLSFEICLAVVPYFSYDFPYSYWWVRLLFGKLMMFTIQTNFLCLITYALWLFGYRLKIFRSNYLLCAVCSYISLVFIIAWFVISPIYILQNIVAGDVWDIISTIDVHLISPIIFIVFFIYATKYKPHNFIKGIHFSKSLTLFILYPLIYFVGLFIVNRFPFPDDWLNITLKPEGYRYYYSVYSVITNYNPDSIIPHINSDNRWIVEYSKDSDYNGIYRGNINRLYIVGIALFVFEIFSLIYSYLCNRGSNFINVRTHK